MSRKRPKKPLPPNLDDVNPEVRWRLVRVGGPVRNSSVSLRVFGDDVDPDEVTRLLGCRPDRAFRRGDVIPDPKYKRTAKTGSWMLDSDRARGVQLERQIDRLLSRVTDDLVVWAHLGRRFKTDLFCGVFLDEFNRGIELDAGLVRRLADRGLSIVFDIYAPDSRLDDPER